MIKELNMLQSVNSNRGSTIKKEDLKYLLVNEKMTFFQMLKSFKKGKLYLKDILNLVSFLESIYYDCKDLTLDDISSIFKDINNEYSFKYVYESYNVNEPSMGTILKILRKTNEKM